MTSVDASLPTVSSILTDVVDDADTLIVAASSYSSEPLFSNPNLQFVSDDLELLQRQHDVETFSQLLNTPCENGTTPGAVINDASIVRYVVVADGTSAPSPFLQSSNSEKCYENVSLAQSIDQSFLSMNDVESVPSSVETNTPVTFMPLPAISSLSTLPSTPQLMPLVFPSQLAPSFQSSVHIPAPSHLQDHAYSKPSDASVFVESLVLQPRDKRRRRRGSSESPPRQFQCPMCHYAAHRRQHLRQHVSTHYKSKPYRCHLCPYSASQKQSLIAHSHKHEKRKPFACPHCSYSALRKQHLVVHMGKHLAEKPYRCHLCDFSTSWKDYLTVHFKKHPEGAKEFKPWRE